MGACVSLLSWVKYGGICASRLRFAVVRLALHGFGSGRKAQEQADHDEIGNNRTATIGDEGQRNACQWHDLEITCQDDECLDGKDRADATCQQLLKGVAGANGNAETAVNELHEDAQNGKETRHAKFLADSSGHKVGLYGGYKGWMP